MLQQASSRFVWVVCRLKCSGQFLGLVSILAGQLNVRPTKPLLRKDVAPQEDDPDAANSLTADVADQPQSRDTAAPEEDVTDAA